MKEALKDSKYSKLELVDTVYGNDESEKSYNEALALVDKHADLKLIMAPTTVGIAAAAKAMQDEKLCDKVKVSGLGLPDEMKAYTQNAAHPSSPCGASPTSATSPSTRPTAWPRTRSRPRRAPKFKAGRMGDYTIKKDPTRDNGLRILMGPFTKYDKDNVG